jgi:hypothetical protein
MALLDRGGAVAVQDVGVLVYETHGDVGAAEVDTDIIHDLFSFDVGR